MPDVEQEHKNWCSLLGSVNPVFRLGVLRVINLCGWVESRSEVLKQAAALLLLSINEDLVAAEATRVVRIMLLLQNHITAWEEL